MFNREPAPNNMKKLTLIASDYNHAPIGELEKLSIRANYIDHIYTELIESYPINEVVVLSTCNRFEIYFVSEKDQTENLVADYVFKLTG